MLRFAVAIAAVAGAALASAADVVVHQLNHRFDSAQLSIKRGTTVHFKNDENVIHHAYAEGPFAFDSGDIPQGGDYAVAFDKAGLVVVRCAIHPQMRIDIDVED